MGYEILAGGSCFTASQAKKLVDRINEKSNANVTSITGQWLYYVELEKGLDIVNRLLETSGSFSKALTDGNNATSYFITPRTTPSPWSSQAMAIAKVCGVDAYIERGRIVTVQFGGPTEGEPTFKEVLYDRMTENFAAKLPEPATLFAEGTKGSLAVVDIFAQGQEPLAVLQNYNKQMGLGLDQPNMEYLIETYQNLGRPPTDVELFMFAQVNSEHCRHHIFNANWTIDGQAKPKSLFDMIRNTHKTTPNYTVSAYSDNAAVMQGVGSGFWAPDYSTGSWQLSKEVLHPLIKVETHNHPTAIAPFPGAATGSGGEIRDEGAVGRGSMPKAALCGFWVSDLLIPHHPAPWELDVGRPGHYASSLDIMLEAPIGSARYNNEFGRPALTGVFRTLLTAEGCSTEGEYRGYHKPIMIAGGIGAVRQEHALKHQHHVAENAHVIVLGGPGMLIGLGGGAASSNIDAGSSNADLDFDSVQRGNPEMERRAQMVINTCVALGVENPIAFIHDVGAGGLSNALPELVKDAGYGGNFELRQVETADNSMSPLQIWCNESQERYVLLINEAGLNRFVSICRRERCGFSDIGRAVKSEGGVPKLVLTDRESKEHPRPIDLPMTALFPKGRKLERNVTSKRPDLPEFDPVASLHDACGDIRDSEMFRDAVQRVLMVPAVGSKSFLITIADRTVGGLTVRDQMVGPWQTPVADVAVTATAFSMDSSKTGEAMAMGERPTLALISPAASARMAVAESLLNLGAADIQGGEIRGDLQRVKLSANWMAAANQPGEGAALFEAVESIGMDLCPALGVSIPVGKDSMSMKAAWKEGEQSKSVTAPVSVVISAFSVVEDIKRTWTPQLRRIEDVGETVLMFVDLAQGRQALGGSALAQSLGAVGNEAPDVRDADLLRDYFDALAQLHESGVVLAYHDRSDGGLITTIAEMMFAGRCGVALMMDELSNSGNLGDITAALFNEELGAIFQIRSSEESNFKRCFATCGPPRGMIKKIGAVLPTNRQTLTIRYKTQPPFATLERLEMQQWWSKTSFEMQKLRDDPASAESEYNSIADLNDPGLSFRLTFNPEDKIIATSSYITQIFTKRPRVAILREQGVNGYAEMAFAFKAAGFDAIDVHMTDIIAGRSLADFVGIAACGGFSYGDVLGAGRGWAQSILLHESSRRELANFFKRPDTFSLGVCNGCQMLSRLQELIPGTEDWPVFVENRSQQFEGRFSMVQIKDNASKPSVFLNGMDGSALPIVVSHGEGRAEFKNPTSLQNLEASGCVPIHYVDNYLKVTERYPFNPNGSPNGVAGVTSKDGRVLALMPHPERTILADVASYKPHNAEWGPFGPWVRMFRSARRWVG